MSALTRPEQTTLARPAAVGAAVLGWVLVVVMTAGRIRDELTATLHRDEAIAWTYASLPIEQIPTALTYDVNPPVYFMALHTWLSGGEGSEVSLRALSVLAIGLAAAVAFDAARRVGGARAGWLASAFVLLAPASLALAGLARPYAITFLLGMVALDAAIAVVARARWPAVAVFSISAALLPLTHYWGGLLLLVLVGALVTTGVLTRQPSVVARTVVATGIALVAVAPWAPTLASQLSNGPLAAHRPPDLETLGTTLTLAAGGRVGAWVVGIGLAVAVGTWWWRGRFGSEPAPQRDPGRLLLVSAAAGAAGVVVAMWAVSQARPLFTPNYAFVVLAPLPVLVGVYLSRRWWGILAVLAALALVALPDFTRSSLAGAAQDREIRGPEYAIGTTLAAQTTAGDVVVTSPGRVLGVRYYLGPDRDYVTPIGRVYDGRFDYRDRVSRLEQVDPVEVTERLTARPAGTRLAFVHDIGLPVDHPYWIALDEAMDDVGYELRRSESVEIVDTWRLPEPYEWIGVTVFEVVAA